MRTFSTLAAIALISIVIGCAPKKKPMTPPPPQPASPQAVQAVREAYARAYPDSRVGAVIAARPEDMLVAVGDVNGNDFHEGLVVTFIDMDQRVLTTGTIVRILPDQVHVQFDRPTGSSRAPHIGDLMVRLPAGGTTL